MRFGCPGAANTVCIAIGVGSGVEYEVNLLEMKATRVQVPRNISNEEHGDIPAVRVRAVRRMGTEFGTPRMGYMSIFGPPQPLPMRS